MAMSILLFIRPKLPTQMLGSFSLNPKHHDSVVELREYLVEGQIRESQLT
jgi:hypothetical protein